MKMRQSGRSIYAIANDLNLKPTTVSYWCRNVALTKKAINRIHQSGKLKAKKSMLVYTENLRSKKFEKIRLNKIEGAKMIQPLSSKDILMIGLGLYWGEGYKYENCELGFTNGSPHIISFYIKWLNLFGVTREDLIFRLTINEAFRPYESKIKQNWIRKLGVGGRYFTATTFVKTNLKKADVSNLRTYWGTLRVKVRRGGKLRDEIIGALEYINSLP